MTNLGRLEKIELRDIWKTEDQDFTPWLAREDNVALLADTLGLELEIEAQEKEVGPFRADILCKDLGNDSWVLIENQLERTDHTHLGQLITYAAGLKAVTIVWIASRFTDEHRAALDWLNTVTDDDFRFFALEVELWKIGGSPAAPKFNIVSKPNEWSKTVGAATRRIQREALTDTKKLQLEFWEKLHQTLQSHDLIRPQKPYPQHWTNFSIGRSGMHVTTLMHSKAQWMGIELYISDKQNAQAFFYELSQSKEEIETELGYEVEWKPLFNRQTCKVALYQTGFQLSEKGRWGEYQDWMIARLEDFNRVFRPRVKLLEPDTVWDAMTAEYEAKSE